MITADAIIIDIKKLIGDDSITFDQLLNEIDYLSNKYYKTKRIIVNLIHDVLIDHVSLGFFSINFLKIFIQVYGYVTYWEER